MRRLLPLLVIIPLMLLCGACASYVNVMKESELKLPRGARVALLPFENLSGTNRAAEKVTDFFQLELLGKNNLEIVEFGEVYEAMRRQRIRSSSLINSEQIDSIAADLNVAYIVTGAVLEYEEFDNNFLGKVPQVSLNCRLVDCESGKAIWAASASGSGDQSELVFGIGAVKSADKLARKMSSAAAGRIAALFRQ